MGLMLSILVFSVGVIEAISCYEKFRLGYIPLSYQVSKTHSQSFLEQGGSADRNDSKTRNDIENIDELPKEDFFSHENVEVASASSYQTTTTVTNVLQDSLECPQVSEDEEDDNASVVSQETVISVHEFDEPNQSNEDEFTTEEPTSPAPSNGHGTRDMNDVFIEELSSEPLNEHQEEASNLGQESSDFKEILVEEVEDIIAEVQTPREGRDDASDNNRRIYSPAAESPLDNDGPISDQRNVIHISTADELPDNQNNTASTASAEASHETTDVSNREAFESEITFHSADVDGSETKSDSDNSPNSSAEEVQSSATNSKYGFLDENIDKYKETSIIDEKSSSQSQEIKSPEDKTKLNVERDAFKDEKNVTPKSTCEESKTDVLDESSVPEAQDTIESINSDQHGYKVDVTKSSLSETNERNNNASDEVENSNITENISSDRFSMTERQQDSQNCSLKSETISQDNCTVEADQESRGLNSLEKDKTDSLKAEVHLGKDKKYPDSSLEDLEIPKNEGEEYDYGINETLSESDEQQALHSDGANSKHKANESYEHVEDEKKNNKDNCKEELTADISENLNESIDEGKQSEELSDNSRMNEGNLSEPVDVTVEKRKSFTDDGEVVKLEPMCEPKELSTRPGYITNNANDITSTERAFWLIFSGDSTKAMSKDWHSSHFCCWQCDESLTGQRYVLREDHPYCIKCYESVFANSCEECSRTIGIDSKDLSYKDKHWHEACFTCSKCRVSLVDKQFGSKADKIYCGNCYDAQFASRCDGCGQIFRAGTKKMEYKTRQWHEQCFCCCVCKVPIGTKSFIPREQEIYCAGCYEEKFATRCVKCNKIITSGGVTYKNEPWHRECFTCTNCNTSLAGQRFTSRDEKPYCADCFGELFAKRCTACCKPITGIGGTRFISFEDRHWHNDCFICATCKSSLVGRGFITDADDIICPDCAKQKLM